MLSTDGDGHTAGLSTAVWPSKHRQQEGRGNSGYGGTEKRPWSRSVDVGVQSGYCGGSLAGPTPCPNDVN